jgi:D-arabinose 1-dehydrogenase-like Zn-dependent alcohol dehydrogenase
VSHACAQVFAGPDQPLQNTELALPTALAPGEVLVEISLATLCGSDLHTLSGQRREETPCILGHEAVGHIVDIGSQRPSLRPGDRVTWSIADSCGTCPPCREHYLPEKCHKLFKYGHAPLINGSGLNGCYASHILLRPGRARSGREWAAARRR